MTWMSEFTQASQVLLHQSPDRNPIEHLWNESNQMIISIQYHGILTQFSGEQRSIRETPGTKLTDTCSDVLHMMVTHAIILEQL